MRFLIFVLSVSAIRDTYQEQVLNISTLKFIYVIARHGSRAPLVSFPLDTYSPNDARYWPDGPGQLTRSGKIQAYNTGVQLRQRYDGYLGPWYNETEIQISSNPAGRDSMSAQLLAAGLFPPVGEQIWNPSLLWQPIPIGFEMFDVVDVTNKGICPKFNALQSVAYENSYQDLFLPRMNFINLLTNVTGQNFTDRNGLKRFKYLYDALYIEKEEGFKLPVWATEDFMAKLKDLTWQQYRVHIAGLPEMVQLTAGPVLQGVVAAFESEKRGKMAVLMSHDNTIFVVAQAMGFFDFEMPEMAAYMILEVHGQMDNESSDIVQVMYYKNGSVTEAELLDMPMCHHPCPLRQFNVIVERFALDDCVTVCGLKSSSVHVGTRALTRVVFLTLLIFMVMSQR